MNCLHCEIKRAKLRALFLFAVGNSLNEIAIDLSNKYGQFYFVRVTHGKESDAYSLERVNSVPPHKPFLILAKDLPKCPSL